MANKPIKKQVSKTIEPPKAGIKKNNEISKPFSFKLEIASLPWLTPYLPGLILFIVTLIIGLVTYHDYGISWDEFTQRHTGEVSMNYVLNGDQGLFTYSDRFYGVGFELPLISFERLLNLTDPRAIYLMRHIATHILFLISVFAGYVLIYRLFKSNFIAILGFMMLAFAPRIYGHSFFNSKDIPFLSMFLITLSCSQIAFEKNKAWLFFILGALCGYTTSIRIMGFMLGGFISLFLFSDILGSLLDKNELAKKDRNRQIINLGMFLIAFIFFIYIPWPYLWKDPIHNIVSCYKSFSHFNWHGFIFTSGKLEPAAKLPWTYFPTWFLITNPELWLLAGFAGIILLVINFFKKPLIYLKNTKERNFILYLLCFWTPIIAVLALHSVIYDDWRQLYFIYPSFVLLALYFINMLLRTKYRLVIKGICILELLFIGYFLIRYHPFTHVYFNNLVSHAPEYIRKNYEMDYWGCSNKQGLDYIIDADKSRTIKIYTNCVEPVRNNIVMLPEEDRGRIQIVEPDEADYIFTNFRDHPYDYPSYKVEYSIPVLNSTIFCIFKTEKDVEKHKQLSLEEISILRKAETNYPDFADLEISLGAAFGRNLQFDSAEIHTKRALELLPNKSDGLSNLSIIYNAEKKYSENVALLHKIIDLNPKDDKGYMKIGEVFFNLTQYDSSEIYDKKALEINPTNTDALNNLAGVYFFYKKYPQAIDAYKKAVEIRPDFITAYTNIGACYFYLNKYDSAIIYLNKAIFINKNYNSSYQILAATYKAMGKPDSANKYEAIIQRINK